MRYAVLGCGMGIFYLWSLAFSAEFPKRGIQFAFSLIRVGFLAYLGVRLSGGKIPQLTLVLCGLLSYKLMLTLETVWQGLQAFKPLSKITLKDSDIENRA